MKPSIAERLLRQLPEPLRMPVRISSTPWSSVTFSGARHVFGYDFAPRPDLAALLDAIEFDLPGHLVADIAVESEGGLRIEALTIETA